MGETDNEQNLHDITFALMFIIPFLLLAFLNDSIEITIMKRLTTGNADTN
jgi:hypothetical protein